MLITDSGSEIWKAELPEEDDIGVTKIIEGIWVVVEYQKKAFPGIVTKKKENGVVVNAWKRAIGISNGPVMMMKFFIHSMML